MTSRLLRVVAAVAIVVTGLAVHAGVASAHSVLLETAPSAGGTVATSPKEIRLTFNESVEIQLGAIRLLMHVGDRSISPPPPLTTAGPNGSSSHSRG